MARLRPWVRVLAMTFTVALASCTGAGRIGDGGSAPGSRTASNAAVAELLPTKVDALPTFDLATYEQLIGQLRGTPVIVNIWGSWCAPCRDEAPDLAKAAREYGDRVQFLGIDILDDRAGARAFIEEFGWTYPSVFDVDASIRDGLGLVGQPVTLFYGSNGELVDDLTRVGIISLSDLRAGAELLLV